MGNETKTGNVRKFSGSPTHLRRNSVILLEDAWSRLHDFFRVVCSTIPIANSSILITFDFQKTYPSLSKLHVRLIVQKMLEFLQLYVEDLRAVTALTDLGRGGSLLTCGYFLTWVSSEADNAYELCTAVLALRRAMKDCHHYSQLGSLISK